MKLYTYFRSSAAYRVRIALQLKGIACAHVPVHLGRGAHREAAYAGRMAAALVPVLEVNGQHLAQSMAIIEYLNETHPAPPLLPADPWARAQVRALAQMVACDLHPLNNLRVLKYLVHELGASDAAKSAWYRHWARSGLEAFERQLAQLHAARGADVAPSVFCWGGAPTLADCCLVPQIFNAQRFGVPLDGLPRTLAVHAACERLDAFQQAHPSRSADHEN